LSPGTDRKFKVLIANESSLTIELVTGVPIFVTSLNLVLELNWNLLLYS